MDIRLKIKNRSNAWWQSTPPPTATYCAHSQVCVPLLLHVCLSGDEGSKPLQTPIRRESSFNIKEINELTCIWPGSYALPAPCNMTDMSNRNLLTVSFVPGQLRATLYYTCMVVCICCSLMYEAEILCSALNNQNKKKQHIITKTICFSCYQWLKVT